MTLIINGVPHDVVATILAGVLQELGFGEARVATAHNGEFVSALSRCACVLQDGDLVEILVPMQGG